MSPIFFFSASVLSLRLSIGFITMFYFGFQELFDIFMLCFNPHALHTDWLFTHIYKILYIPLHCAWRCPLSPAPSLLDAQAVDGPASSSALAPSVLSSMIRLSSDSPSSSSLNMQPVCVALIIAS